MIRLADYVIKFLEEEGIDSVFTISGGGSIFLNDALAVASRLKYYCCHNEQALSIASEGYARVKNNIGVNIVTTGPGGTNAITGVCCAWMDSIPQLNISGQVFLKQTIGNSGLRQLGVQEVNIIDLVKPITKYAFMITDANTIRYHLEKAVYIAKSGRPGPVWIDIPADIQNTLIDESLLTGFSENEIPKVVNVEFGNQIQKIISLMKSAKRPLLLAGLGVRLANADVDFLQLAEKHKIPILTTWNGNDVVPSDHDLFIGRPGTFAHRGANFAIQNCDLLITIGTRLPFPLTGYNSTDFARNARVVMVDIDKYELDKPQLKLYMKVESDAGEFLKSLNEGLEGIDFTSPSDWLNQCKNWKEKYPVILPEYKNQKDSVNSYHFIDVLSRLLNNDDVIITDMGLSFVGTHPAFHIKKGQRLITNSGFAPMGWGLPAAIGACIAKGMKKTICIHGEGGLQMNIQELATIMHHRMPIKLFVLNNGGYLTIKQTQQLGFNGRLMGCNSDTGISFPDMLKISNAYEIDGIRISNHDGMENKIAEFLKADGPGICELMIDHEQDQIPKAINRRKADGKTEPTVFEDMYPFLEPSEIIANRLEPVIWND